MFQVGAFSGHCETLRRFVDSLTALLVSPPPRRSHENKNTFTKYSKCFFRRWNMKYVCETLDICVTNPQTFDLIIPTYFRPCLGKSRSQKSMHNVPVQTFGKRWNLWQNASQLQFLKQGWMSNYYYSGKKVRGHKRVMGWGVMSLLLLFASLSPGPSFFCSGVILPCPVHHLPIRHDITIIKLELN